MPGVREKGMTMPVPLDAPTRAIMATLADAADRRLSLSNESIVQQKRSFLRLHRDLFRAGALFSFPGVGHMWLIGVSM